MFKDIKKLERDYVDAVFDKINNKTVITLDEARIKFELNWEE